MTAAFDAPHTLTLPEGDVTIYRLDAVAQAGLTDLDALPFSIRLLLENVLRHHGNGIVSDDEVALVAGWQPQPDRSREVPFMPGRVVLQDFTGVPAVVDLAAMRDAMVRLGGDPAKINPLVQTDLVIDHSVQVDFFGTSRAFELNVEREMERNGERYALLRWAQQAFADFNVDRIDQDDYGFCDACGVNIGIKRLEARPTATLCIDCKTLDEIKERQELG